MPRAVEGLHNEQPQRAREPTSREEGQRVSFLSGPWPVATAAAAIVGASAVGGYFLLIDLLAGRPFWTPAALGAALFLGERLAPDADPNPALVFAYSLLHVAVFVGIAGLAAVNLANRKFPLTPRRWMGLLALILWAGFQVGFAVLAVLAGGWLWSELGWLHISVANLLAASLMAVVLVIVAPRHSSVPATLPR